MPSPLAVLPNLIFTKAGGSPVDLQAWPRVFLQLLEGGPHELAEQRGTDHTTPYHEGGYHGVWRPDRLAILLAGQVAGDGTNEADRREDTFTARMELRTLFGGGLPGVLGVDTEDGTSWTISARVTSPGLIWEPNPEAPGLQRVSVRLLALDPPEWAEV